MGWFEKKLPITGSVLFRGSLPPRLEELELPKGTTVEPLEVDASAHWSVEATHPTLGPASITCLRNPPTVPPDLFAFDVGLTDAEKNEAKHGRAIVSVRFTHAKGHLLRDRKRLLTYLGAIMGRDGLVAMDHASTRSWSRAMLDDELSHEADVDVSALYALHGVGDEKGERCAWLHTHGLASLGKLDFDILNPHETLTSTAADQVRALAFATLEDSLKVGSVFTAFHPGGQVMAVDARTFDARAPADERAIRAVGPDDDGEHTANRVVLCDAPAGFLAKLLGRGGVRASRALSNFPEDRGVVFFSSDATDLTAERARSTWPRMREIMAELADLRLPTLVKLGYPIDGGDPTEREHMWFEVHEAKPDAVDATLIVEPFQIAAMKNGDRGVHPLTLLTDWQIMTPLGPINPRSFTPVRILREHPEIRQKLKELSKLAGEGSASAQE